MAHAVHELSGGGAGGSGQRVPGVTQVVEVKVLQAERRAGAVPDRVPEPRAERVAVSFADEQDSVGVSLDPSRQVQLQLAHEWCRERDRARPSISLGTTNGET